MSGKRFKIYQDSIRKFESDRIWGVKSETNSLEPYMTFKEAEKCCDLLNEQQATIEKQKRIIKSQDAEISRQYKLCLAMSGILREEFGVYDVFDRTKDRKIE